MGGIMTNFSRGRIAIRAFCFASALLFSSFCFAQSQPDSDTQSENQVVSSDSPHLPADLSSSADSQQTQGWNWNSQGYGQPQSQPSTFGLFVRMVLALSVVLVIAYLVVRLLKRGTKLSNSDDPFLRHVSHLPLSASRSVDVVTILDHAYILGVSDNAVNLVGEITDKELVNSMNLYADKNDSTARPRSFEDVLNIFMPRGKRGQSENVYGSSAWNASESLRRQRERLGGGEEE